MILLWVKCMRELAEIKDVSVHNNLRIPSIKYMHHLSWKQNEVLRRALRLQFFSILNIRSLKGREPDPTHSYYSRHFDRLQPLWANFSMQDLPTVAHWFGCLHRAPLQLERSSCTGLFAGEILGKDQCTKKGGVKPAPFEWGLQNQLH